MYYKIVCGKDFKANKIIKLNANDWYAVNTNTHVIFNKEDGSKQMAFNRKFLLYYELEE